MAKVTEEMKKKIYELHDEGKSERQIEVITGVARSTVWNHLQKRKQTV